MMAETSIGSGIFKLSKYYHGTWLMLVLLSTISVIVSYSLTGEFWSPLLEQLFGLGVIWGVSKVKYQRYSKPYIRRFVLLLIVILLISTVFFGRGAGGRSLSIGGVLIQTFYLISVLFVFYLCAFCARYTKPATADEPAKPLNDTHTKRLLFFLLLVVGAIAMRNISTAIILFLTGMSVLYVAQAKFKYLIFTVLLCVMGLGIYYTIGHFRNQNSDTLVQTQEDRSTTLNSRVQYWLTGKCDSKAYGRQMTLAKAAISRSFTKPAGPGKGLIKKYMAEGENDFVFALICEELTIVVGILVLLFYFSLFYQTRTVAKNAKGCFSRYFATGTGVLILLQALVHIGANTGVIPATGQTLPLISRGFTSFLVTCAMIGVFLNMTIQVVNGTDREIPELMV